MADKPIERTDTPSKMLPCTISDEQLGCGRAWVEIDLDALAYNIAHIKSKIPESCQIMAIVKANAYGHGIRVYGGVARKSVDHP